jgi:hypothetical protein
MPKNFKKYSKANLADAIGDLDAQIKMLDSDLKAAKAEAKARGISEASGDLYAIKVISGYRVTLDKEAVVQAMGEDWVQAHSKTSGFEQVRVTALKSALIDKHDAEAA